MNTRVVDQEIPFMTEEEFKSTFSANVIDRLARYGIRRSNLCKLTGMAPASLYPIVKGERMPSGYAIAKICKAIGSSLEDLLHRE